MKEQDLIDLGFKRIDETPESSGSDINWYYYSLDIGDLSFISNASDEVIKKEWYVRIFDYYYFQFQDVTQLVNLITILKNNKKHD